MLTPMHILNEIDKQSQEEQEYLAEIAIQLMEGPDPEDRRPRKNTHPE